MGDVELTKRQYLHHSTPDSTPTTRPTVNIIIATTTSGAATKTKGVKAKILDDIYLFIYLLIPNTVSFQACRNKYNK